MSAAAAEPQRKRGAGCPLEFAHGGVKESCGGHLKTGLP